MNKKAMGQKRLEIESIENMHTCRIGYNGAHWCEAGEGGNGPTGHIKPNSAGGMSELDPGIG